MKMTFLSDNKTEKAKCHAEWGLAILIESRGRKVLFDVGASAMFARNAEALEVDLSDVDAVVISHGHYDHTEGMEAFCQINHRAPVYIHKDAIGESYALDKDGNIEDVDYGILWSAGFKDSVNSRLVFTHDVVQINDNMTLVGNIPLLPEYPMTESFFRRGDSSHPWVQDPMDHEQFLVVEEEEGVYIFSGCSHKGVMSVIARAGELFAGKKILGLIAGMHLYVLPLQEQKKIVDFICDLGIEWIFPVHCTGMEAIVMFKERMGDRCVIASAGESYDC